MITKQDYAVYFKQITEMEVAIDHAVQTLFEATENKNTRRILAEIMDFSSARDKILKHTLARLA